MNAAKYFAPVLMSAMLSGCATTYPIAQNFREQAQPLTLSQVKFDPDATRGATVIWGGIIVNTINDTNGGAIYIMNAPLDPNEKPVRDFATSEQFIAASSQYLDPESFSGCRLITVAGKVTGVWTVKSGNRRYTYPVVDIEDIRVWPIFPPDFEDYGTPGWFVGPSWWWYGGDYHPPSYYDHNSLSEPDGYYVVQPYVWLPPL